MQRREFITLLGAAAVEWPVCAHGQQSGKARRIAVLLPYDEHDPQVQALWPAFKQHLQDLGWTENRNIRFDYRFAGQNAERIRTGAGELVAAGPDVIFVWANPAVAALRQATQTIPIVFALVSEPVGSGFVANLARPGGNVTGFQNFETAIGGKWLQLLREIAPGVRRAAFVYNEEIAANVAFLRSAEATSASLGMTVTATDLHEVADIDRVLTAYAERADSGLIVAPNPFNATNRERIIALAARLRLPAIYPSRHFAINGGLVAYSLDQIEQQRGAAAYVDRILRGAKPGDLPVQLPTKYELVINLKTAKALGLDVPLQLQQRADEVIE